MQPTPVTSIPIKDLHFDRSNPRLAEYGISPQATDDEILVILWDAMDVRELVQSITASGFFPHEALIVARENNKNVVIEGNRRLAAVKVLLNDQVAKKNGWEIPTLSKGARKQLESLPVIISIVGIRGVTWVSSMSTGQRSGVATPRPITLLMSIVPIASP